MSLIEKGESAGLIKFDEERVFIFYSDKNKKKRNWRNPEEKVQAEAFLQLILNYGYSASRIAISEKIQIGADLREADIIVYNDDACLDARIVVECKKEETSEREFKQAISQAFSYAATGTVRAKYFWVTSNTKDEYFEIPDNEPKHYLTTTDIPHKKAKKLAKYKYAFGGGEVFGQKLVELETVTEGELTKKFKQAHNSLWGGGELNPSEAFDELDKLIFCKIWDERNTALGDPYKFQIYAESSEAATMESLAKRIHDIYNEGKKEDKEVFKDGIKLSPEKLKTVVGYLENINLSKTDLDSKGRAFETFMGSFFRGDFGQYFTPRTIVKFIVDVLPITHKSYVLDTSCGSGGFLLHALDKVRQEATKKYPGECGSDGNEQSARHHNHWHQFAEKRLYGIEINEQIARTAKMNMIIHDDGHTNVIAADGLLPLEDVTRQDSDGNTVLLQKGIHSKTENKGFKYNHFDFIITNPPFGSTVKQTEQAYMHQYGYAIKGIDWLNINSKESLRDSQNTEVLFIEQCHKFLVEGGYLAIVVPDGILTNSSMQYVRDNIEDDFRIVAVVSLPQTAFSATGAGVKSSILFLKKHKKSKTNSIKAKKQLLQENIKKEQNFIAELENIDNEKKNKIKYKVGFENIEESELLSSDAFFLWKKEVNAEYKEKVDLIKEELFDLYLAKKQRTLNEYPIFMAIAEEIGFDATGKETETNELENISIELKRFINEIEEM